MARIAAVVFSILFAWIQTNSISGGRVALTPNSTIFFACPVEAPAPVLHTLNINDCIRPRCRLIKGSTGTLTMEFTSPVDIPKLNIVIQGIIGKIPMPWAIPGGSDACAHITPKVPGTCVRAGVRHTFSVSLNILASYPSLNVVIYFRLNAENGDKKVCWKIPAMIMGGRK